MVNIARDPRAGNYRRGRDFELYIADVFEQLGFDITLATNSKGAWDVVATRIREGRIEKVYYAVLMQCKTRVSRAKDVIE